MTDQEKTSTFLGSVGKISGCLFVLSLFVLSIDPLGHERDTSRRYQSQTPTNLGLYDQAGNQRLIEAPASQTTTNTWDDENRCKLTQLPSVQVDTFVYNGDGLRFEKQDSTGTTKFVWDGQAYLVETDASSVLQAEYTSEPTQFGALVSQRRLTSGLWVPSYYQYDGLGSTAQLTSAGASVTDSYLYKAFGEPLLVNGTTINPFRWVGQVGYYFDPDAGNCYVRARIYDPVRARWLSQDPIGFRGGDPNLYTYVFNCPTIYVDPSGTQAQDSDDRGVSERYCDAARETPQNKWLLCACRVSRLIDGALAGIVGTALITPKDSIEYGGLIGRGKWLRCMRSCMVLTWQAAYMRWKDPQSKGDVSEPWRKFCDKCRGNAVSSDDCCKIQVEAEQQRFETCKGKCGSWEWGSSFPVGKMPGWPEGGDFNDLQTRIDYGVKKCCEGNAFGGS